MKVTVVVRNESGKSRVVVVIPGVLTEHDRTRLGRALRGDAPDGDLEFVECESVTVGSIFNDPQKWRKDRDPRREPLDPRSPSGEGLR